MPAFPDHDRLQPSGADSWQTKIAELLDDVTVPAASSWSVQSERPPTAPGSHPGPRELSGNGAVHEPPATVAGKGSPSQPPAGDRSQAPEQAPPAAEPPPEAVAAIAPHLSGEPQPADEPEASAAPRLGDEAWQHDELAAAIVKIRGRSDGVFIEIGHGPWPEVLAALDLRLEPSAQFFHGGQVAVDVGARPLVEPELHDLHGLLLRYGLTLRQVLTASRRTFESALALGLAATLAKSDEQEAMVAQPVASNVDGAGYFVYSGTVRSGQVLQRTESIVVLGDVNPGGHIISAGHILVWGRLRGIAHAGAEGDMKAVVAALDLDATQLRIGNFVASRPEPAEPGRSWFWQKSTGKRPEVAYLDRDEQKVVIDPWDESSSRMVGLSAFRP